MDFQKELTAKTDLCNQWLKELAPNGSGYHAVIYEAMNYSINAGGKRIRPVLAMGVCEMLGGRIEAVKHFACAVEFIHTYSLIHDDLPCMDNDDLRRGMPTNHKKFGEVIALLAGDALLNYAFETAAKAELPPEITVKALRLLSCASGTEGMIGGQVIDINGAKNAEELMTVHRMKTGALISAAAGVGAVIGGADDEKMRKIREYSDCLGIAFQIKDDILDVTGDQAVLGKPIGSDSACGKVTFIDLYGLDGSKQKLDEYTDKARAAIESFGEPAAFLTALAEYLLKREK